MSKTKLFLLSACVLACLFPLAAAAQNCPNPVSLNCPELASGTTLGGPSNHTDYGCTEFTWALDGPEAYYTFTLTEETNVQVILEPTEDWDPAFVILPASGGDCSTTAIVCMDEGFSSDPESAGGTLPAGTYYIVVESYDASEAGAFDLTFTSPACEVCADADGDTYFGYDASECLSGNDCCDAGNEASPGCTAGSAAAINPGAKEICGDGIDNDCDGQDDTCPNCGADGSIACSDTGTVDTTGGSSNWNDYCGLGVYYGVSWSGPEHIFSYTPASDGGVIFGIDTTAALDLFVLPNYGDPAVCNPNSCLSYGGSGLGLWTQNYPAVFYAQAGETYFISVDGYEGAAGSFDYDLECRTESGVSDADIFCKDSVSGNTTGKDNNLTIYKGIMYEFPAPEYVYTLQTDQDAEVAVLLTMQAGIDLGLMVIEDTGDGCSPGDVITFSDYINDTDYTEYVSFSTLAGVNYYLVVDGWLASEYGTFDLEVTCAVECGEGFDDCGMGYCSDVSSDVDNCGACDAACDLPNVDQHDCVAGVCAIASCDANFDDCDATDATGCEADLQADPANCGSCSNACGATQICAAGSCQDCAAGETVCDNTCVSTATDPAHCGGCGNACDLPNVNQNGCAAGSCTVVTCAAGFADCDANAANGCETTLGTTQNCGSCGDACEAGEVCSQGTCQLDCPTGETDCSGSCKNLNSDPDNCGSCGYVCDLANVGQNGCAAGSCTVVTCDAGFANCDANAANGCETTLGTTDNCGACGHACNAGEACTGGTCQATCGAGETNCNGSCVNLNTDVSNCGACGHGCPTGQGCANGTCCADADADGHSAQTCGGDDCDDTLATVYPGAEEICNDIDDDCNGTIDDGEVCKRDKGCSCAASEGSPASGLYLLLLAVGLVLFRRSR